MPWRLVCFTCNPHGSKDVRNRCHYYFYFTMRKPRYMEVFLSQGHTPGKRGLMCVETPRCMVPKVQSKVPLSWVSSPGGAMVMVGSGLLASWYRTIILALGKPSQEDPEFKASLGYRRHCIKQHQQQFSVSLLGLWWCLRQESIGHSSCSEGTTVQAGGAHLPCNMGEMDRLSAPEGRDTWQPWALLEMAEQAEEGWRPEPVW